jgi:hypothetical protein
MTFWVALRGTVSSHPESVEGDDAEPVVAFLLADAQYGQYRDQLIELNNVSVCEVILRGAAAIATLATLKPGDPVVALGLLHITAPLGPAEDAVLVSLAVEAYSIGRDIAARA